MHKRSTLILLLLVAALASAEAMAAELDGEVLDWDGLLARHQAGSP